MKAIVRHTMKMYDVLYTSASDEVIEGQPYRIYRGQVSKLFATTGIGATYYTEIFEQLEHQGSITYLQRGSKNVDTVIVLHYAPTEEAFRPRARKDLTSAEEFANLIETVKKNDKLIGGTDITKLAVDLVTRIGRLEQLTGLQQGLNTTQRQESE